VFAANPELHVPLVAAVPFAVLLALIAILPLVREHWWHHNRNKGIIAAIIGIPTAIYLLLQPHGAAALWHGVEEYLAFIIMLAALYTISGGILVTGNLVAKPTTNVAILAIGAVLANLIGTTGASMVLLRPILRANHERKHRSHIPIFFIFIVSNCGGLLTPLGDPPLFLGFLQGIDFAWTLRLWPQWLFVNGLLLLAFLVWDMAAMKRESAGTLKRDEQTYHPIGVLGLRLNAPLLLGVVGAVILKKFAPLPVSEIIMIGLALISLRKTPRHNREQNHFSWEPILEVAILFAAIFVAMVPALAILKEHGGKLGIREPWQYFWITGGLSSILDNAPTYLSMGQLAAAVNGCEFKELPLVVPKLLTAISCGAVFMGANTYIGNGPNFMVKAIAEQSGYPMPSFFGYMGYAILILMPIFVGVMLITF
jgi:Na+/H+ antiporter NhaD/arsenite permease-like protein